MDLPLHPLVVHAAVVLVPLAMLLLVIAVSMRSMRTQIGGVAAGLAALGAVAFVVAHRSGTALAEVVGTPYEHMRWADPALASAIVFAVLTTGWYAGWWWLRRRGDTAPGWMRGGTRVAAAVALLSGAAACVLTFLVGHTGAEAVWLGLG